MVFKNLPAYIPMKMKYGIEALPIPVEKELWIARQDVLSDRTYANLNDMQIFHLLSNIYPSFKNVTYRHTCYVHVNTSSRKTISGIFDFFHSKGIYPKHISSLK